MKTPEEIAEATVRQYITAPFARDQMDPRELIAGLGLSNAQAASIFDMAVAAIEADRAQRDGTPCVCGAPFESVECQKRAHLRGPQIALDPEPYVWSGTKLRTGIKHDGEALEFAPRPGFSQNREDYA